MESISRVKKVLERQPGFLDMILTPAEIAAAKKRSGKHYYEFVAGRFSAKEAFSKATGYGIGKEVHWHDVSILNASNGRPIIRVRNFAYRTHVAITHSGDYVNTMVTIEKLSKWDKFRLRFMRGRGVIL
ncbi:Phosphopantetheinyl transferase (holo-ACP synthase) (AcpS) [Eupransor demetentiae]|uniref:Phosphopantetheinyl transferase (Holo-ACP synthase) (AcpS) n=2 Tax=Eupransor demetentiae TaxID=3109584 RepID=A0ABM9N5R2_9LACO|nr:Phosphopantetheinyl transferase (holo-ACP synthase) (AcpS) [Lactobacillaceae bacterium LMG 33000]